MKIKVLELFAGIGACSKALNNIGIDVEIVDAVEIDKYAIKSFNAVHNTNFEPQDITKWDKDIEVDLITHGSPCTNFSVAGKQEGGDKGSGTQSSLMYESIRIIEKLKPKYVLWENVKNLLSKKHRHNFDAYIETMNKLGYNSYFQVLNAKDYGIPQNRERVYTISIRKDLDKGYIFPEKEELKLKLKDMLEDKVDEKYYLSEKGINYVLKRDGDYVQLADSKTEVAHCPLTAKGNTNWTGNFVKEYIDYSLKKIKNNLVKNDVVGTITASAMQSFNHDNCHLIEEKQGIDITWNEVGKTTDVSRALTTACRTLSKNQMSTGILEIGNYSPSGHNASRIVDNKGIAPTVMENHGTVTATNIDNMRIRKLTPLECWRLMGFDDEDFYKAEKVNSNTQLYKEAGNSICVPVLEKIFRQLF